VEGAGRHYDRASQRVAAVLLMVTVVCMVVGSHI